MRRAIFLALVVICLGAACAPPATPSGSTSQAPVPDRPARTLVVAIGVEPKVLAARAVGQDLTVSVLLARRAFNADLALFNEAGDPIPYLAEALPQLNSDTWKVAADGTMQTTYKLRPNLAWHDGTPLAAEDFIFAYKLYATPDLGSANSLPINLISSIEAPDTRTIVIQWKQPYPGAGSLQSIGTGVTGLPPLPRHILSAALEGGAQALLNHPYWNNSFVGLGPYRLERWEPGSFIEGVAFDKHALGAPKIARLRIAVIPEGNTVVANMINGDVQMGADSALSQAQLASIKSQLGPGRIADTASNNQYRAANFQGRPDYTNPAPLRDLRVRKALAFGIDRPGINQAIRDGLYTVANSPFPPTTERGRAADAAAVKFPFDLRQSAQLMTDAGFTKGADGFYVSSTGERLTAEARTNSGVENESERSALASGWRQAGFDFSEATLSSTQAQDVQSRSTFPGVYTISTSVLDVAIQAMASSNIPRAENGWRGSGYAGYSSPEMDRLVGDYTTALAAPDRSRLAAEIARVYTTDLPAIPLFFPRQVWGYSAEMTGPSPEVAPESTPAWNVWTWEFK